MIIEMRTYRLKPGSVADAEKRFAEGLKERVRVSPLGAFFHTEVGPLNRIIHCWSYEDLAHRAKVRAEKIPGWPPKIQEFIEEMESKIIIAAPFSPKLEPRKLGNLYEIRTYTMLPGATRRSSRNGPSGSRGGSNIRRSPSAGIPSSARSTNGSMSGPTRTPPTASASATRPAKAAPGRRRPAASSSGRRTCSSCRPSSRRCAEPSASAAPTRPSPR